MLKNFNEFRTFGDNLRLGILTAFSAGMVNVMSVILFFAFTSNVTGHYAILAQEIAKGNWYQAGVVAIWISLFLFGSFLSNLWVIHFSKKVSEYLAHSLPIVLEIICLFGAGVYVQNYYTDSLQETEALVGIMLFAMGIQNGLTASISNFTVKTTHLTGLTTDLGIHFSMLTKREFRKDILVIRKTQLLLAIMVSYLTGGILSGIVYYKIGNYSLYAVSFVLFFILCYDSLRHFWSSK